jgi:hypothetical protein
LISQAIESVMSRRTKDKDETRHDLLQHLIDNGKRPDNGKIMSARDIIDQMAELLLAGSETTSGTLAYDMTLMSMPEFDHPAVSPSYSCFFLEVARHPEVRAKLAASLPRLSLDAPLIDGKTVREDPQYEYLNACIKGVYIIHPFLFLPKPGLTNGIKQKTSVSTPSPRNSDAAPYKNPQTSMELRSRLTPSSPPHTGHCTSKLGFQHFASLPSLHLHQTVRQEPVLTT